MDDRQREFYSLRRQGLTQKMARQKLGVSRKLAREWTRASDQHLPCCRLKKSQINRLKTLLLDQGLSYLDAAKDLGCHKQTVGRWVRRLRAQYSDTAGAMRYQSTKQHCPEHGRVTVWPCVACAANARRIEYRQTLAMQNQNLTQTGSVQ